jgi:hypothetical protein
VGLPYGSLRDFFLGVHDQKKTVPQDSTLTPTLKRCSHRPPTELTSHGHQPQDQSTSHCTPAGAWLPSPIRPLPGEPCKRGWLAMLQGAAGLQRLRTFQRARPGPKHSGGVLHTASPIRNSASCLMPCWLRASLPSAASLGHGGPAITAHHACGGNAHSAGPPLHARASARQTAGTGRPWLQQSPAISSNSAAPLPWPLLARRPQPRLRHRLEEDEPECGPP